MDTSLSKEELGALLGDDEDRSEAGETPGSGAVIPTNGADDYSAVQQGVEEALAGIKSEFSEKLGEEVSITFEEIEKCHKLSAPEGTGWYVGVGTFTNNGDCPYAVAYPSDMAHEIAKRVTGIDDLDNSVETVGNPLKELTDNTVTSLAAAFGRGFHGSINDFAAHESLDSVDVDGGFLRARFSTDISSFYYFFGVAILSMLSNDANENMSDIVSELDAKNKTDDKETSSLFGAGNGGGDDDFSSLLGEGNDSVSVSAGSDESSSNGMFSSALSSLGDELLKNSMPANDVEFPSFDSDGTSVDQFESGKKIDMLMDVPVEISVELGNTQRTVAEVLDLGRGTILDLNKLAGEPLDIKVNNKLIAKGEVVVIDENFGVRIVEILSPKERVTKK